MPHRVGFGDLKFDQRLVLCEYPTGRIWRWMPFGMPRLSPILEHSAFFLFKRSPRTGQIIGGPEGTGFIVGRRWKSAPGRRHYYAVSNWHVAVDLGATIIRINTANGKSIPLDTDLNEWQFQSPGDDLAVVDITEHFSKDGTHNLIVDQHPNNNLTIIDESVFVTKKFITEYSLGFGEDVFMVGLFVGHPGNETNLPVARFGNISRLADDAAPIEQPNGHKRPSHLADMRSRGGFSGSPVFVYRTPSADLTDIQGVGGIWGLHRPINNLFLNLLGVHCSQFPEEVKFKKGEAVFDPILEGDVLKIPSSMTVVVPAWRITDLLNEDYFEGLRVKREKNASKDAGKLPVAEKESAPSTTDDNPQHKEAFTRLVSAAAKKQKSAG
jgi:hypothetical protein